MTEAPGGPRPRFERDGVYALDDVLPFVAFLHRCGPEAKRRRRDYGGDPVNLAVKRLKVFALHGVRCVRCGIEGRFFAKERPVRRLPGEDAWTLHLYAVDPLGREVLMTKDHAVPKCRDGHDGLANLQPMCADCNRAKDDRPENRAARSAKAEYVLRHARDLHRAALDLARDAEDARKSRDAPAAAKATLRAFALDARAASVLPREPRSEPLRSELLLSAARLALVHGRVAQAARMARSALAGHPPDELRRELDRIAGNPPRA